MAKKRAIKFNNPERGKHSKGKNYLLVIGINLYQHFSRLNNAVRDAEAIRDVLLEYYQFEEENTISLFDHEATRENILETLYKLESQVTSEDNFLFYFAGHGVMNSQGNQGFWIPVEAERKLSQYIANTRILDILKGIKSRHTYLMIDSCFSGSLILRGENDSKNLLASLPSRRVLTSGRKQVVTDGPNGGHSPFANCILTYLRSKPNERVSALELEYHVQQNVPKTTEQNPEASFIYGLGDQSGQFVFIPQSFIETDAHVSQQKSRQAIQSLVKINPQRASKDTRNRLISPIDMVFVEGGSFQMGSEDGREDEMPIHTVQVASFYMGKYPITQKEWEKVMGYNPSFFKDCEKCPVEMVYLSEIKDFIRELNQLFPESYYRLPTEAEWEFAAKGGRLSQDYIYSGGNDLGKVGWFDDNSKTNGNNWFERYIFGQGDTYTQPVGKKRANELGIYDMSGNVWEWCSDRYNGRYYQYCLDKKEWQDPIGPEKGQSYVVRGGSWDDKMEDCQSTSRGIAGPKDKGRDLGFRLVAKPS